MLLLKGLNPRVLGGELDEGAFAVFLRSGLGGEVVGGGE